MTFPCGSALSFSSLPVWLSFENHVCAGHHVSLGENLPVAHGADMALADFRAALHVPNPVFVGLGVAPEDVGVVVGVVEAGAGQLPLAARIAEIGGAGDV